MSDRKPNIRQLANTAFIEIRANPRRRKPPPGEAVKLYKRYAEAFLAPPFDDPVLAQLMPDDLNEARIMADFAMCMTTPSEAGALGLTRGELRRKRHEALKRLQATAHRLLLCRQRSGDDGEGAQAVALV